MRRALAAITIRGDVGVSGRDEELNVRRVGVDALDERGQKLSDRRPVVRENDHGVLAARDGW